MRAASAITLLLPLAVANCGSQADLIIGELTTAAESGSTSNPSGGGGSGASSGSASSTAGAATDPGGAAGTSGAFGDSAGEGPGGVGGEAGQVDPGGGCVVGEEALVHRYSFDGTGATVVDRVGDKDGSLVGGAALDGSGVLTLPGNRDGQADQYLDLPNGLVSALAQVTVVVWTTWQGGAGYQRVFDFGISDLGETQGNSGKSYLAVMPSTGFANGTGLGAEIAAPGFATQQLPSPQMMLDRPAMVALSFESGVAVELFVDGKSLIRSPTTLSLSDISDQNVWVGQSQWSKDHAYRGTFDELRIYDQALNACQLMTIFERGADAL
jgi:hypothetical protein